MYFCKLCFDNLLLGGSVSVISNVRKDWGLSVETEASVYVDEMPEMTVMIKGSREEGSLDSKQPSQTDWIKRYMEQQEEVLSSAYHLHYSLII